jgi:glycosyltransferase involved in cell wall biosynthesis
MWEDDSIPRDWPTNIHATVERVIVPCDFYADVFKDAGVKVPIHVVPGGVNPETDLPLPDRSGERPFTFLVLGDRGVRKGLEVALNALRTPYWFNKDVRLVVKTRPGAGSNDLRIAKLVEPRVVIWEADVPSMAQVFAEADCYLYPSYGDGWGLTPRRAVMHGLPTIAPRHTGVQVGLDHWATQTLEMFTRPFSNYAHDQSKWFKPDFEELADGMRWVYEHYTEARCKAMQGRQWLSECQSWACTARGLSELMERYA